MAVSRMTKQQTTYLYSKSSGIPLNVKVTQFAVAENTGCEFLLPALRLGNANTATLKVSFTNCAFGRLLNVKLGNNPHLP